NFENRQSGCDGNVTLDKIEDHFVNWPGLHVEAGVKRHIFGVIRALARLFPGEEFGIDSKPCSRSSIPKAAASRKPMEHRCPVTFAPRLWAAAIAAES